MFLKPEDLENVRVGSLLGLATNTGLGVRSVHTCNETVWTGPVTA